MTPSLFHRSVLNRNARHALLAVGSLVAVLEGCSGTPEPGTSGSGASPSVGGAGATSGTGGTGGLAGMGTGGALGGTAGSVTAGSGGNMTPTGGVGGAAAGTSGAGAGGMGAGMGGAGAVAGTGAGMGGNAAGSAGASGAGASGGGIAGSAGSGGGAGGNGPLGPELTDPGTFTPTTCTITPTVTPASKIAMVGIATFTTDLAGADRAVIQFGKTTTYTLEAPVNWAAQSHRTLLLGMPANTDVHYRVIVMQGNTACVSADATYRTGAAPSGAPSNINPMMGPSNADPAPGFIIAQNGAFSYIINKEGEVVWAYRFPLMGLTRSVMSWDGQYMFARDLGPFNAASGGSIYRVGMDGEGEMQLNVSGGHHHDVIAIPTGIAYPGKRMAGACDCLFTANADGSNSECLVDLDVVFGKFANGPGSASMEKCHVNALRYYEDTDSYSASDREKDAIAFISGSGEILGSVGAQPTGQTPNHAVAEGADGTNNSEWRVQHGHDLYEPNKLVVWSNGSFMGGQSRVLHYTISGGTASLDWQYTGTGNSPTFSDAVHLPNGNFLGTNSQNGNVHEFDAAQALVVSYGGLCRGGYPSPRTTLYGRPPGR